MTKQTFLIPDAALPAIHTTASFGQGPDCLYRYTLGRRWGQDGRRVNFVMLNPSTADASEDDPTIRRVIRFARDWGYSGLEVTNLFAARSTDPDALAGLADPVGPFNDDLILMCARRADLVVCGWGAHPIAERRAGHVLERLRAAGITPHCLARTRSGAPGHPLFLRADRRPVPMT